MKVLVAVDNSTIIDRYYLGEPALCIYLEDEGHHILFDTGYSDIYLKNLRELGVDLNKIDTLVLSHGHNDHTGGLRYISALKRDIDVYGHTRVFEHKEYKGLVVSSPVDKLPANFHLHLSDKPQKISAHLTFMGEIARKWQEVKPLENDYLYDDSALLFQDENSLSIITGCSHSGIINICEYGKTLSADKTLKYVLGGFHLLNNPKGAKEVADYFKKQENVILMPCHCTDLAARFLLACNSDVREVGVSSLFYF